MARFLLLLPGIRISERLCRFGVYRSGEAVLLSFFASEFQQKMLLKNDRVCVTMEAEKRKGAISVYRGAESSEIRAGR